MIIFDFNQIAIANLMEQIGSSKAPVDENLVRHMVLNTIRANVKKFKEYGEVVIACDNKRYWRRDIFPYYKAHRKKNREDSGHDWNSIFECLNKVRDELKNNSPYRVIDVDGAEADDVIGVLTKKFAPTQKIMILSSDKDFVQLQVNSNVSQYSPTMKKAIKTDNAGAQLKQLILEGDKGDGIPNVLSNDSTIVDGIRQKALTKVRLAELMNTNLANDGTDELKRNWSRNKQLIDLNEIPQSIVESIISRYEEIKPATRQQFMNYMIANRLKNLIEVIDEF
jgi:5'-3' exonuclease